MSTQTIPTWTLGDRLAKSRDVAGFTTREIAVRLGVSKNTVSNWETGATVPKHYAIEAWARLCSTDPVWIEHGLSADQMAEVERLGVEPGAVVVVPPELRAQADHRDPRNRCSAHNAHPQLPFDGAVFVGAGPLLGAARPMQVFEEMVRAA